MSYSVVPMEDIEGGGLNPFADPSVQRALSSDAPTSAPAASSAAGAAGSTAASTLAGFMASEQGTFASLPGSSTAVGGMSASSASGPGAWENTLDEAVSVTLVCGPRRSVAAASERL